MKKHFRHNKFTAVFTDENGYFSLTGDVDGSSGAVSSKITDIDPRFELLDKMHLANCKTGQPMHCLENGYYHFKESGYDIARLESYWNVSLSESQIKKIMDAEPDNENNMASRKMAVREVWAEVEASGAWTDLVKKVYALVESIPSDLTEETEFDPDMFEEPDKAVALAQHLDIEPGVVEEGYNSQYYNAIGQEFMVLTDDEANDMWEEYLDNYIDDCLEIPEHVENYFDREAWKRDARMDGRGHCLSGYDGCEYDETVDGETYYIYRTN